MAAYPSVTISNAYHRPAAFRAVYARQTGGKFGTLGSISGGVLNFSNYEEANSVGQNKAHAVAFTAKCNMKQASLVELELLDTIVAGDVDFLFKLSDAATVSVSTAYEGWVLLTAAQVGVKAKVNLDGDPSNNRHIELEWSGSLLLSEFSAAVKATLQGSDFDSNEGSNAFMAIGTYTHDADGGLPINSHMHPNGVSKVELENVATATYVDIGKVNNFKGSLEFLSDPDGLKRHACYATAVDISYDWMQTDAADLLNLATVAGLDINLKITFLSGLIVTLSNQVGLTWDYEVSGDFDKIKVVKFKHTGRILTTSFDGIVSGA